MTSSSKTVYIEEILHNTFVTFGEISDIQLPKVSEGASANRGFGFITFTQEDAAEDAIDNMHLNEFRGNVITVNAAKPQRIQTGDAWRPIWETEEWNQEYGNKPLPSQPGA
ncbi:peptidylprolyl isomerase [Malassezia japonica]|uniref:Peptidylprolyl isomerase n=1 Tax=Malassezia japonica TaxID=223818 RepID=A0AAF0J957_9BASI|nr:peptidylprolyl isomerase [Malassezia japonica]WFD38367.1 peptidylprolyl isomerase [Malassezia japonica]